MPPLCGMLTRGYERSGRIGLQPVARLSALRTWFLSSGAFYTDVIWRIPKILLFLRHAL